ncbi:MAG: penicillin-binding protein 2 [Alphaproteobacteria bacterium]|nr:penicillin-binding protein 2 [Alphaproteobacteria bacterium]
MVDTEITNIFDRRSALFLTGGAILTSVLILRMLQMQVFQYKNYTKKSENNSFRIQVNIPQRGNILSASGSVISKDIQTYRIYIIPEEADNVDSLVTEVAKHLHLKKKRIDKIFKTIKKQRAFQPVLVSENSNWGLLASLAAKNMSGLHITDGFSRSYEMGPAGAQLFGYVGAPTKEKTNIPFYTTGITGLEKKYNDVLSGEFGKNVFVVNALGRITTEDKTQYTPAVIGNNIKTTIRENIQKTLYDSLVLNKSGCGVALDIKNGDVLAMVSAPSFDPNLFKNDDADEYISSLLSDRAKPFINKTIEGLYPPGSTFKIIVALAALEAGAITPNEKIFCPGFWEYGNHTYHCWEKKGHGWVNLSDALKHSCDVYFWQVALRIGISAIKDMALKLGLNQKYIDDILPNEMSGIIPDKKWKEKNIGAPWVHGDTIISGIGQGYILTNCLQLAVMMARVASNKKIVPRLIYSDTQPKFDNLGLSAKNIKFVMNGLEQVTKKGGTASGSAINVNGKKMAGKTGTSQVRNISKKERLSGVLTTEQLNWNLRNHGLFVGYAPTDNPRYAVCAITEHSGGSGPAAKAVANTLKELLS